MSFTRYRVIFPASFVGRGTCETASSLVDSVGRVKLILISAANRLIKHLSDPNQRETTENGAYLNIWGDENEPGVLLIS